MYEQLDIFDLTRPTFQIDKPIRLIELFSGLGSQAMALRDLGSDFEHYRVVEFDRFAVASYNAIHGTDFETTDIRNISGVNLGICDTDKYCYIMTYSFPCQDLSVAGKQKGMAKGGGTRSGLLWEVERLLNECTELPQVLLMENVPQVHSKANMPDFQKWIDFLESKGYSNYWRDLNAKDYGVAQNRDRCFMVSLLGQWNYKFPQPIPLERKLKDYLEDEVDEKYYINTEKAQKLLQMLIENGTLKEGTGYANYNHFEQYSDVARCIKAIKHDLSVVEMNEVKQIGNMDADRENFENPQCGRVYDSSGLSPTINTCQGGQREPKIIVAMRGRNPDNPSDRTAGNPTEQRLEPNSQGICNTLTSVQKDNMVLEGVIIDDTQGFEEVPRVYTENSPTLRSERSGLMTVENVCINDRGFSEKEPQISIGTAPTLRAETHGNLPKVIENQYRIRKLTPLECWRLMGFSDEDFHKAEEVNSNTQLYKQAGNSIVKNVLMAIFGQMIPGKENIYKEL